MIRRSGILALALASILILVFQVTTAERRERDQRVVADALADAVRRGDIRSVRALLDSGAEPDGWALMVAVNHNQTAIVQQLLDAGANPNITHDKGATALGWAASAGHPKLVDSFLRHGADVNLREPYGETTPLMSAAESAHPEVVEQLIRGGADTNLRAIRGYTALMAAAMVDDLSLHHRATRCAKLMLARGAKVNVCDAEGRTAISLAAEQGNISLVELLLVHHAGIQIPDGEGKLPLDRALEAGQNQVAALLREKLKNSSFVAGEFRR